MSSDSHLSRIWRVFLVLSLIVGALHYYIAVRLLSDLPISHLLKNIFVIWLIFSAVAIPVAMLSRFVIKNQKWADATAWIGLSAMGLFSSLFVLTLLRDLILIASSFLVSPLVLHQLAIDSSPVVIALALIATAWGFINARRVPAIVNVKIPLKNLPEELIGFTLVQISDIHIGPTIKGKYLAKIVDEVNSLRPQIIAITGDLVDGSVADLASQVAPLKNLQAEHGSYFVTGNHEYYSGADEWNAYIRSLGIKVLMNEHQIINHRDSQLIIAGITDFNAEHINPAHKSDPQQALGGTTHLSIPKIMLAHQPRSATEVAAAGADLQLSGHTHGGQFWPWNFFVPLQQPYTVGLHKLHQLWIYVNRGTGYWRPPKRLGGRSEITKIILVRA
ncbi:MAG: metallophosphoesterase [Gammaproteobacteria bacterium]|nr:MAG: metallophosphoesterase [Gammaproteobacteria bacterium]